MAEHGPYKNAEGYSDPTATDAIKGLTKPGEIYEYKGREVLIVKNQGGYSNILTLSDVPAKDSESIEVAGRYTTPGKLTYAFNNKLGRKVTKLSDFEFEVVRSEIVNCLCLNPSAPARRERPSDSANKKAETEIKKLNKKLDVLRGMYDELLERFLNKESEEV